MNLRALHAFSAVISEGSVTGAARAMNLSQPAVSRLISVLEAELKLKLFRRGGRSLTLTDHGQEFAREAGRILAGVRELPTIAEEIRTRRSKIFRVVSMPRTSLSVVAPAIAKFSAAHPDVKVSLDVRSRRELESWIAGREYDMSFGNVPISVATATSVPLARAALEVLMPVGHPLAAKGEVTLEDLTSYVLIQNHPGQMLRRQTDVLFDTQGIRIEHEILATTSAMAQQLVAEGAGLTILDRLSTFVTDDRFVTSRPLLPQTWVKFGIIRHRDDEPNPLVDLLTEFLRNRIRECAQFCAGSGAVVPIEPGGA